MAAIFSDDDRRHMTRALALARRGQGRVEPNPMVGCVLARGPRVIAEGYHRRFGGPHAEVEALRRARESPNRATAYVTLEPCCHYGKTPPCTDTLIEAGVARVVSALRDPNRPMRGKGLRRLRAAGIRVDEGLLEDEARQLNRPYLTAFDHGRPYVILKWAQSLDGRIATRTGDSRWISSEPSRRIVHRLRSRVDAILIGSETALADDPMLTARGTPIRRVATRVVLDRRLRLRNECRLVVTARDVPTLVLTSPQAIAEKPGKVRNLERRHVEVVACPRRGAVTNLLAVLKRMSRRGWTNLLVEGGGQVLGSFLDGGLADEAFVFVSPRLIGGSTAPMACGGLGVSHVRDARGRCTGISRVGGDQLYHIYF